MGSCFHSTPSRPCVPALSALEHPRYVMQYKAKQLDRYIGKYVQSLADAGYQ